MIVRNCLGSDGTRSRRVHFLAHVFSLTKHVRRSKLEPRSKETFIFFSAYFLFQIVTDAPDRLNLPCAIRIYSNILSGMTEHS